MGEYLSRSVISNRSFFMKGFLIPFAVASIIVGGCSEGPVPFPEVGDPYAITSGPHDHFFASYFGINSVHEGSRQVYLRDLKFH